MFANDRVHRCCEKINLLCNFVTGLSCVDQASGLMQGFQALAECSFTGIAVMLWAGNHLGRDRHWQTAKCTDVFKTFTFKSFTHLTAECPSAALYCLLRMRVQVALLSPFDSNVPCKAVTEILFCIDKRAFNNEGNTCTIRSSVFIWASRVLVLFVLPLSSLSSSGGVHPSPAITSNRWLNEGKKILVRFPVFLSTKVRLLAT